MSKESQYIPSQAHRFKKVELTPRQEKAFRSMYTDLSYSFDDIAERFGIAKETVGRLAKLLNIPMRKGN